MCRNESGIPVKERMERFAGILSITSKCFASHRSIIKMNGLSFINLCVITVILVFMKNHFTSDSLLELRIFKCQQCSGCAVRNVASVA